MMAYDQNFFLGLAAKGKDEWNKWRQANKGVLVTFRGIDFSEAPRDEIDFSGFEFGDHADFLGCKWRGAELGHEAFTPGRACFIGAVFGGADFTSAVFGDGAFFHSAAFGKWAFFKDAIFGDFADFTRAAFGDYAVLTGAVFGNYAIFSHAAFGDEAFFTGVAFGHNASFTAAIFGDSAAFICVGFRNDANFTGQTIFGDHADFTGATFGYGATFDDAFFKGSVEFTGQSTEQWTRRLKAKVGLMDDGAFMALKQRYEQSWIQDESGPDRFLKVSFARARFDGEAVFKGRSFEWEAIFTDARFYDPPGFDAVTNASRIDFTGARIGFARPGRLHWTSKTEVPVSLRALRKIAEETKNHDLERDLYIEERKAERGVYLGQLLELDELEKNLVAINKQNKHVWLEWRLQRSARNAHWLGILTKPKKISRLIVHLLWIAVMGVYWALSNYGRNFVLPTAWLIAGVFFFDWRYTVVLAPLMAKAPDVDKYKQALGMLALGNTVPFVGPLTIDSEIKKFLFCPSGNCLSPVIPPEGYQLLVIFQNLFSITLVFFIGLALRNYFKIK
jgi:uncharacterized protein YjbI with pentapeptide repeats